MAEWSKALVLGTSLRAWVRIPLVSQIYFLGVDDCYRWCLVLAALRLFTYGVFVTLFNVLTTAMTGALRLVQIGAPWDPGVSLLT